MNSKSKSVRVLVEQKSKKDNPDRAGAQRRDQSLRVCRFVGCAIDGSVDVILRFRLVFLHLPLSLRGNLLNACGSIFNGAVGKSMARHVVCAL